MTDDYSRAARCDVCRLTPGLCVCASLPRVDVPVEFLIVQHHKERNSQSNTGALTHRLLENSRLFRFATRLEPFDATALIQPDTVVLFPEPGAPELTSDRRPRRVVVLDATWRQARRMSTKIAGLRRLPFVTMPPAASRWVLREPPEHGRLSTVEAVAQAVDCLGFHEQAAELRAVLDRVMPRMLHIRSKLPRPGLD